MRTTGLRPGGSGLRPGDHLCLAYERREEMVRTARQFLAEGLAVGEQVAFVGSGDRAALLDDLRPLDGFDSVLATGSLRVLTVEDLYGGGGRAVDPRDQVDRYVGAVEDALAEGYAGLRVAADVTDVVVEPHTRDAFARYEHQIDRRMAAGLPFTALCCVDRARVGDEAAAELGCLHPASSGPPHAFHLHAVADGSLELVGEVDATSVGRFARAVARVLEEAPGGRVRVACAGLRFCDHTALLVLDDTAARFGVTVELVGARPVVGRLALLVGAAHVVVTP